MFKEKLFEELSAKWDEVIEKSPIRDFEKNAKAVLIALFDKLDLVTREEFDVQQQVLLHMQDKVRALESKVAELERRSQGASSSLQDAL